MMIRRKRLVTAVAAVCSSMLFLTACGGGGGSDPGSSYTGDPVPGGTLRVLQFSEPRTLDPAGLSNTWVHQPLLGNALYGTLMIDNPETLEIEYTMATSFDSADGGSTFTLTLRPGLEFTDGTPLDAAAVKFNWDRLRDPALGSQAIRQASQVVSSEVVDATTLKVVLRSPNPRFPLGMVTSSMNWIASPAALAEGQAAFDRAPVGAGPFVLTRWNRQDVIELERNPGYWDAPKPYVDGITLRAVADTNQRANSITTGSADLASESNWSSLARAQAAGADSRIVPAGGGQYLAMNFRRAPFDDVRARRAVVAAVDPEAINAAVYDGDAQVPGTLFSEDSRFYTDVPLPEPDRETAQRLFDELAADGKAVSFTFMTYPETDNKATAEALQAQLSAFDNVDVDIEVVDFAAGAARAGSHDFDMMVSSAIVQDPDYALWTAFHSDSAGNFVGVDDRLLDEALDAGRTAGTEDSRRAAYENAQQRLFDLAVGVWYVRATPAVLAAETTRGVHMYTLGSPLPEELWLDE